MSASSVEKAFLLLEFLAGAERPVSLNEVTEGARLSKPTACRLLRSLQNLGYVARPAGSRDYLLGPRVARLGSPADPYAALKAAARPLMRRLHEELNETVNLGVLEGAQVVYVDFLETTRPLRYIVTPGESDPYWCTALGRAVAARMPPRELKALLAVTELRRSGPVGTQAVLLRLLEEARHNGVAEEREEAAEGVSCLAVDLGFCGWPAAALSVAVPLQRLTPRRREAIIRALKALE